MLYSKMQTGLFVLFLSSLIYYSETSESPFIICELIARILGIESGKWSERAGHPQATSIEAASEPASSAMTNRGARTCLALFALLFADPTRALIDETLDVIFLGKEIGEKVLSSWDIIGKPFNATGGVELPIIKRRETQILSRLAQVSKAIERLELNLQQSNAVTLMLSKNNGKRPGLELRLLEMADLLSRVSSANRQMREYVRLQQTLERSTLENFAEWCVSHDPGALPGLLERVHALVVPPHRNLLGRGVLQLILEDLQVCMTSFHSCLSKQHCNDLIVRVGSAVNKQLYIRLFNRNMGLFSERGVTMK